MTPIAIAAIIAIPVAIVAIPVGLAIQQLRSVSRRLGKLKCYAEMSHLAVNLLQTEVSVIKSQGKQDPQDLTMLVTLRTTDALDQLTTAVAGIEAQLAALPRIEAMVMSMGQPAAEKQAEKVDEYHYATAAVLDLQFTPQWLDLPRRLVYLSTFAQAIAKMEEGECGDDIWSEVVSAATPADPTWSYLLLIEGTTIALYTKRTVPDNQ